MFSNQGGDMAVKTEPEVAVAQEIIETKIFIIRGKKVMLDRDLASLYGVQTIRLREQVKRNSKRFPRDFMFQMTDDEVDAMVSHFAIPSRKVFGGHLPYVFTEHGILMLSSVLNSERAISVNIQIMRTFAKIREMLSSNDELRRKIEAMERKYDQQFQAVFEAIKQLLTPPEQPRRRIGFHHEPD
jgi:hypothetical protein